MKAETTLSTEEITKRYAATYGAVHYHTGGGIMLAKITISGEGDDESFIYISDDEGEGYGVGIYERWDSEPPLIHCPTVEVLDAVIADAMGKAHPRPERV